MATRAIRYDQLNFDNRTPANEAVGWTNYPYTEIQEPLSVAVSHQIENASEIQNQIGNIRSEQYSCQDYYGIMQNVYKHLLPQILHYEMNAAGQNIQTLMREKLIQMRDVAKAKTTKANPYFDGRSDSDFTDPMQEMTRAMGELSRSISHKYFGSIQNQVIHSGVQYNCIESETTDAEIDDMVDNSWSGNWGSLWRFNTYYLLNSGYQTKRVHQYPAIPDDIMEGFMENLIENHPAIALRIAQNDQFFQDNPMAQSIGHSWTSRNRSDDCWFKVPHDQVNKNNTVVFAPPRTFFGKFTPTLSDMCDNLDQIKAEVVDFLMVVEPKITVKVDAANVLADKTTKSMQEAVVAIVQGLLDDKDTVSIGTGIIGHISGIAHLPIDTSSFPNGHLMYSYHDYTSGQDRQAYLYPQHMVGIVSLSDFNVTDEVQTVLFSAYQENLESRRTQHANQCAHLARQISQQTTRHDAEIQVITDAFTEYQTQV